MLALSFGIGPQHFLVTLASTHVSHVQCYGGRNATLCAVESVTEDGRQSPALGRATYGNGDHNVLSSHVCMPTFVKIESAEPSEGSGLSGKETCL